MSVQQATAPAWQGDAAQVRLGCADRAGDGHWMRLHAHDQDAAGNVLFAGYFCVAQAYAKRKGSQKARLLFHVSWQRACR